jgi:GAF domain-containing protein
MTESVPLTDTFARLDELTAVLAQMGAVVLSAETIDTTIDLVSTLAAATIANTTGAGVTLVDARGKLSRAATDSLVESADSLQYEVDSGPCLTAWRDRVTVRVDDTATESRWPQWTAAVAELGVRSVLSAPLVAENTSIGAMKVYSLQPRAYSMRAEAVMQMFARQAAILLTNSQTLADARRLSAQLTEALTNRDTIGQAKGILMARGAANEQSAFAMLVTASQQSNTKLRDVARQLVGDTIDRNAGRSQT